MSKYSAYIRLMRIDKPIGFFLLLWPTLWALWLSSKGTPDLFILTVFVLGVFFMRSAGCVINDYADRNIDGFVKRTRKRPIPAGDISLKESKLLFIALVLIAFILVLSLNRLTLILSVMALFLALIYPFMKRVTYFPQVVLGMAFGWSIPMAYAATTEQLPLSCWLLFLINVCWAVSYDTEYALVDRDDDEKINVKSTASLFKRYDRLAIGLLQFTTLLLLVLLGLLNQLAVSYYACLVITLILFFYQQWLLKTGKPKHYFMAFLNNNYIGLIIFIGIVLAL